MGLYKSKSKIHGYGLFSSTSIRKGDVIGIFEHAPAIYHTRYTLWLDETPYRITNILKYSNHSNKPNAYVDFPYLIASKNINKNTEITWDYGW